MTPTSPLDSSSTNCLRTSRRWFASRSEPLTQPCAGAMPFASRSRCWRQRRQATRWLNVKRCLPSIRAGPTAIAMSCRTVVGSSVAAARFRMPPEFFWSYLIESPTPRRSPSTQASCDRLVPVCRSAPATSPHCSVGLPADAASAVEAHLRRDLAVDADQSDFGCEATPRVGRSSPQDSVRHLTRWSTAFDGSGAKQCHPKWTCG